MRARRTRVLATASLADRLCRPIDGDNDELTVTGTIAGLLQFQSGADEPLTFSLVTDTSALEAQGLTSGGVALTYAMCLADDGDGVCGRPAIGLHVHAERRRGAGRSR